VPGHTCKGPAPARHPPLDRGGPGRAFGRPSPSAAATSTTTRITAMNAAPS